MFSMEFLFHWNRNGKAAYEERVIHGEGLFNIWHIPLKKCTRFTGKYKSNTICHIIKIATSENVNNLSDRCFYGWVCWFSLFSVLYGHEKFWFCFSTFWIHVVTYLLLLFACAFIPLRKKKKRIQIHWFSSE